MKLRAWKVVLIAGSVLVAIYFVLPTTTYQNIAYSSMGMGSVIAILAGVRRQRPETRIGWYLIATAGLCFTLGDDVFSLYPSLWHISVPFPSYADALYLAGYPFLFAGVLRLTRSVTRDFWREENADAAIVAIGVLSVSWQFLMDNYVHDPTVTTFGMLVNLAYPMMDVALVFIVLRAILFRQSASGHLKLLAAAMLVMFVADFTYDLMTLHNSYSPGNAVDALFLFEYVLVAVAALHPSLRPGPDETQGEDRATVQEHSGSRGRLPVVLVAGFVSPTIIVVATALHDSVNVLALGIFCIIVFALIAMRLGWMVERLRRQALELEGNLMELTVAHVHRDELEANLRHQTLHDPLTGLANRMLFEDRLTHARERSTRHGGLDAVFMIDLDDFKGVNDAYGHFVGDQLLVAISNRLERVTRSSDTLCRFGGDEFLYLAESISDREEAEAICERLIGELDEPFTFGDSRFEQHASVGVVICDSLTETNAEYIRDADAAMYEAKRHLKGRHVVFAPEMHSEALSVFSLTQELREASQKGDLTMYYQPIVELSSLKIVGFEALMRWPHPHRGMVAPDVFIPLAEQSELIVELDTFALREASDVAATWGRSSPDVEPPFVTVNLSARQLHDVNLVQKVREVLAASHLTPDRLIIEITERAAMVNIDDTMTVLNRLRHLGVRMALDDFGTGYSSLSYLTMLRPEIIKIDRSFVATHPEHDGVALLETIVSLGHRLEITMLAEGIETEDQMEHLRELGCQLGQGFLFAQAVSATQVSSLLLQPTTNLR